MSNPHPPVNRNRPPRDVVGRIAREEADAAWGVPLSSIIGVSRCSRATAARYRAFTRILAETGCSIEGLAHVWGCHPASVRCAKNLAEQKRVKAAQPYDDDTKARLAWARGPEAAARIIAGNDPATQHDVAAWRGLGRRTAA